LINNKGSSKALTILSLWQSFRLSIITYRISSASGAVPFITLCTVNARVSKDPVIGLQSALNYNKKD